MEEQQEEEKSEVSSSGDSETKSRASASKKTTYGILAAVIVFVALGSLFFVGKNSFLKKAEASPTPSPSPSVSPSPSPSPSPTSSPKSSPKVSPTPTPTPSPTSSPSPTFSVTGVTAAVSPTSYSGSCPKKFDFTANITANAAGTVTYKWARSDDAGSPTETMTFASAGTQATVPDDWTLGASGTRWEKVQILTPNTTESNQANFSLNCP